MMMPSFQFPFFVQRILPSDKLYYSLIHFFELRMKFSYSFTVSKTEIHFERSGVISVAGTALIQQGRRLNILSTWNIDLMSTPQATDIAGLVPLHCSAKLQCAVMHAGAINSRRLQDAPPLQRQFSYLSFSVPLISSYSLTAPSPTCSSEAKPDARMLP